MKNLIKITGLSLMLCTALLMSSCKKDEVVEAPKDVVDVALGNSDFSTLTKLLTDNGLVSVLRGTGPFTVFAPTNAAFAKIDASKLTKDELLNILKSHVISGKVLAADVKSGAAPTLGSVAYLTKSAAGVFINGKSQVTTPDLAASNGIIHVIDNVIVPPTKNLVEIAVDAKFTELVALVLAADASVATALSTASAKGLTVFAPTDAAFQELYKTLPKATLLLPANKKTLTDVLLYHVVEGRVFSSDLSNVSGDVATLNRDGGKIGFDLMGGAKVKGAKSGNSTITSTNILGTNGVIHVIDKVLLP